MCGIKDSNFHSFRNQILSLARLPIPPMPLAFGNKIAMVHTAPLNGRATCASALRSANSLRLGLRPEVDLKRLQNYCFFLNYARKLANFLFCRTKMNDFACFFITFCHIGDAKCRFLQFLSKKIWSYQKKVVPLRDFSFVRVCVFHIYTRTRNKEAITTKQKNNKQ